MVLARSVLGDLTGLEAVVVGRSNIVGKPLAQLLCLANATVTIAHSGTQDIAAVCRRADLLVVAVGHPEMVRGNWIKPGAVVIDVGISRLSSPDLGVGKTRLVGDVTFSEALETARAITPVPGGVGPMTIACLLKNTLLAAQKRVGRTQPARVRQSMGEFA
jgi:methylenetetrahydrofolate dehydrogenase (NADP+)/methenyltetrahydrofolate cyclohydrolase